MSSDATYIPGGNGGNISFTPGKGAIATDERSAGFDGDIIFQLADGTEFLKLCHDGQAYVRGMLVERDESVYRFFVQWLAKAGMKLNENLHESQAKRLERVSGSGPCG